MRQLIVIALLMCALHTWGQTTWQFNKAESRRLSNGVEVVLVRDSTKKNIYLSLYASYRPVSSRYYAGEDKVFAYLAGGRILLDSVFVRTLIVNSGGLDSALRFIKAIVFRRSFGQSQVRHAIMVLRGSMQDTLPERAARLINYPRDYALNYKISEYLQPQDIDNFRHRFDTKKITLILAGNLPDSTFSLVDSLFSGLKVETHEFSALQKRQKTPRGLYFINSQDSIPKAGFVKGFFLRQPIDFVRYRVLQGLLKKVYPHAYLTVHYSALGSYLGLFIQSKDINQSLEELSTRLTNPARSEDISQIKGLGIQLSWWLDSLLTTAQGFGDMAYMTIKSGKKLSYLSQLRRDFLRLNKQNINDFLPKDLKKKVTLVIVGNELLMGCDILKLSAQYDINFVDTKLYRYKIIKKGFNAWTVIDRYIRFVSPQKKIRNLSYRFDGLFFVDSTFLHLKGYVWKKAPNLYRYQTFVISDTDTLAHSLMLFDGHRWIDSTALGSRELDSLAAAINMQKTYILGEIYYKKLGYKPKIICEPALLSENIYKIRVKTGNVYFDELYDMATHTKLSTVVRGKDCWYKSFYYYDYTRVEQGKIDFEIPFTVVEQTPRYTFTQRIEQVNFKPIKRKVFSDKYYFWPGKRRHKGLMFYITRCFNKIKKLCIF